MKINFICKLLSVLVAGIFIYAGILKILDPSQFLIDIQNYHILPYQIAVVLALYLPWLEILCGISIFIHQFNRGALVILFGLMIIFMVALTSAWLRGIDISCGCFGKAVHKTSFLHVILRDAGILIVIGILIFKNSLKEMTAPGIVR